MYMPDLFRYDIDAMIKVNEPLLVRVSTGRCNAGHLELRHVNKA